ncbi:MAG: bifunctional enoyl-CoA hydratase/phosphate acetyltransferase [Alphaproteobacteria bacterium]|nr:bifunctional enoyl-CoA hydratase/phosphate acetyltransferase [Alphaproteobacteria bacterium]
MIRENKTFAELSVGDTASIKRVCTANDLYIFAHASGNLNPLHLPDGHGAPVQEAIAPSMWVGALVSAVLGNVLPGPGTLYNAQSFRFLGRAHVGDELTIAVTVKEKRPGNVVVLDTQVRGRGGETIAEGVAEVLAPARKLQIDDAGVPSLLVNRHQHFDRLIEACRGLDPMAMAVVAPEEPNALGGVLLALEHKLVRPVLIGSADRTRQAAREIGATVDGIEIVDVPDHDQAAAHAVALVRDGRVDAIMKGHLHTDQLLAHVVKRDGGIRTSRRISHAFAFDVPGLDHVLLVSDAAINIAPTLEEKVDIVQNAIDVARSLGIEQPKVGVLSAVETVNPKIPSTLDAAILAKMAERGQITGGLVDGPLAMDNAMDMAAARTKGITSLVAGRADVLIVPNIEAGNMLAKELVFVAHAVGAGVVVGAKVPIILTSRADDAKSRLASCAIAVLFQAWRSGIKLALPGKAAAA